MSRRSKNKTQDIYFTKDVDRAIVEYNSETDDGKRNQIFTDRIYQPLYKLAENVLNTFHFEYFDCGKEDVKQDVVCYLTSVLYKFDPTKNSKRYAEKKTSAFSFLSICAKNYLIYRNNKQYENWKQHISTDGHPTEYMDLVMNQTLQDRRSEDATSEDELTKILLTKWTKLKDTIKCRNEKQRKIVKRIDDLIHGRYPFKLRKSGKRQAIWISVADGITTGNDVQRFIHKRYCRKCLKSSNCDTDQPEVANDPQQLEGC